MTNLSTPHSGADLYDEIARLTRVHGWLRVVGAILAIRAHRSRRPRAQELSNHLKRDIGLGEAPSSAPLPERIGPLL